MQKQICLPRNTQKSIWSNLKMEWSCIIGIPIQNSFDIFLVVSCCPQNLILRMPSLSLNSQKKTNLPYRQPPFCIYEERGIISRTFFTTKEKSDIVASKNLSTSISMCKNKNEIKRSVLKKKWKKNHLDSKHLMLEGCLVQPFFKLGVKKLEVGEFLGLPYNNKLIPHLEP